MAFPQNQTRNIIVAWSHPGSDLYRCKQQQKFPSNRCGKQTERPKLDYSDDANTVLTEKG